MVRFLLQRPVAVIMSTIAFIVLGIVASFRLPVSLLSLIHILIISPRILNIKHFYYILQIKFF